MECFERIDREPSQRGGEVRNLGHGQQVVQGVAGRRQYLRTVPTANPTGVLAKGDVANSVQIVFDRPVRSIQLQQPSGARITRAQTGDPVDRFLFGTSVGEPTDPVELKYLGEARPIGQVLHQRRCGRQGARFESAVALVGSRGGILLALPPLLLMGEKAVLSANMQAMS